MKGFFIGIIIGIAASFFYYGDTSTYIENAQSQEESSWGSGTYILSKVGSGQVAIIHGFIDDLENCEIYASTLTKLGGSYYCTPAKYAEPIPM